MDSDAWVMSTPAAVIGTWRRNRGPQVAGRIVAVIPEQQS